MAELIGTGKKSVMLFNSQTYLTRKSKKIFKTSILTHLLIHLLLNTYSYVLGARHYNRKIKVFDE